MRILQLCLKIPFPTTDGGSVAMHNLTSILSNALYQTDVIAFDTNKQQNLHDEIPISYKSKHNAAYVKLDLSIKFINAFKNLFSSKSFNISRFWNDNMCNTLENKLNAYTYDLVIIESLFMLPYLDLIKKKHSGKVIYRSHNIEYKVWESKASEENFFIKKWYLSLLAHKMKQYELYQSFKTNGILSISFADYEFYKGINKNHPVLFFPLKLKVNPISSIINKNKKPVFYFIGGMNWSPNITAVNFIEQQILPLLVANKFDGKIIIAGKYMPTSWLKRSNDIVSYVGEIIDLEKFSDEVDVLIAPLFTGGGLKIKMIEALALGKQVITNRESIKALPSEGHNSVFEANDALSFTNSILSIYNNPELLLSKNEITKEFLNKYFSLNTAADQLETFLATI